MKIIGFAQLYNELSNGNLLDFTDSVRVCDSVYIYDQASTDNSRDVYEQEGYVVYYADQNRFYQEMQCKQHLLNMILTDHPDTDWILWLDGDTLLDYRLWNRDALEDLCNSAGNADHLKFIHYNLWRSDTYYRTDNKFHGLSGNVAPLWRVQKGAGLSFGNEVGLHVRNQPMGLMRDIKVPFCLVHRGFATDESLIRRFDWRFNEYVKNNHSPWISYRSIDEMGLAVNRIENPESVLSPKHRKRDVNPRSLKNLIFIYQDRVEEITGCSLQEIYTHRQEWTL
jgi:hypothetical protein